MAIRTITTQQILDEEIEQLIGLQGVFAGIHQATGTPELRYRHGGFLALFKSIVAQQLSVAAAATIWQRIANEGLVDALSVLNASEQSFKDKGLSRQKIRYVKSLAQADIDYEALLHADDEAVIKTLTAVVGIGRWTAEIYCLFSLRRADVFAHNDLALQTAAQAAFDLPERPKEAAMRKMADDWVPHRSAAAHLLWAYYRVIKNRSGIGI